MEISWSEFKKVVVARSLSIQFVEINSNYFLKAIDGRFELDCMIPLDADHSDTMDFVANFKTNGNKNPTKATEIGSIPSFAAKTFGTKSLFKRVVGIRQSLSQGSNTITYTATFPWAKFMALEIVGGEVGDTASLYILDTATGTYSTVPNAQLNQFGFTTNIGAGFYEHKSEFDADVYAGLQIKIVYSSMSAKSIGINYVMNEVK